MREPGFLGAGETQEHAYLRLSTQKIETGERHPQFRLKTSQNKSFTHSHLHLGPSILRHWGLKTCNVSKTKDVAYGLLQTQEANTDHRLDDDSSAQRLFLEAWRLQLVHYLRASY